MKVKLEYVWLDGYTPEPNLRSKTKILDVETLTSVEQLPEWSYDGSSTKQAEGHFSDCVLKPVKMVLDPQRRNAYIVLCEVMNPDGTPHETNTRSVLTDNPDYWFGFEQEYTFVGKNGKPLGFPTEGYPEPQGKYYCGVGTGVVDGRKIVEEHLDVCLDAGLDITGINAEVMLGQWEYQVFGKGVKEACDQLWITRYFLHRIAEENGVKVEFHPKPVHGDWNGSGLHTNFSTKEMRETGGKIIFDQIFEQFELNHELHIKNYGSSNEQRLTGDHETQAIDTFSYGVSDRGASIRVPQATATEWKGYLEDRRPASNADPYRIVSVICASLNTALMGVNIIE